MDIGAGHGALARHLVDAGARVLAVELHPARAQWLRERFAEAPVTVIQTDALSLRLPNRRFRVVASPPLCDLQRIAAGIARVAFESRLEVSACRGYLF